MRKSLARMQLKKSLTLEQRKELFRRVKTLRENDRTNEWRTKRGVPELSNKLGVNLTTLISKKLGKKHKPSVLEIGSGDKQSLLDLNLQFGKEIDLHGLTLLPKKYPLIADQKSKFKEHIGLFENYRFNQRFDVIYSYAGIHYTQHPAFVIQKLCNLLRKGGTAIIQYPETRITPEMVAQLDAQGYVLSKMPSRGELWETTIFRIDNVKGKKMQFTPSVKQGALINQFSWHESTLHS